MTFPLSRLTRRLAPAAAVSVALAGLGATTGTSAVAADDPEPTTARHAGPERVNATRFADVQLLTFNDFHGHLEAEEGHTLEPSVDPDEHVVGGAAFLAAHLKKLESRQPKTTITASNGDLIGGSTFTSGLFQDEPSVIAANRMGVDVSTVGNHEFDEGAREFKRMRDGGCHPTQGCFERPDGTPIDYGGAAFPYLAANVVSKSTGKPISRATWIKKVDGVKVGFIGVVTTDTPALVNPDGIKHYRFADELKTTARYAKQLRRRNGVKSIVVLLHEGGSATGTYNACQGTSGPGFTLAERMYMDVDMVVEGHTHASYSCFVKDPLGRPRLVTSAASFGDVLSESHLIVNRVSGNVDRGQSWTRNHLVTREGVTPYQPVQRVVGLYSRMAETAGNRVVGTVSEDITGDANTTNRRAETPMADLVSDAILWGTQDEADGGADLSMMNVGGVRDSLLFDEVSGGEQPGEITYAEAYDVAPFGNLLVTVSMTGQDIVDVLDQQYDPDRGRQTLALGVSEGFSYTWVDDDGDPATDGGHADPASLTLNGEPMSLTDTYRVSTVNFLAEGGDGFTAFTQGTDLVGGREDLANLVDYLGAEQPLAPPEDRVNGL